MAIQRNSSEAQYMRSSDGAHLLKAATAFVKREYRKGWEVKGL